MRIDARGLVRWESAVVLLLVLVFSGGAAFSPDFGNTDNLTFALGDLSEIALIALPMTLLVVCGQVDLSVASVLGLCSALTGWLWDAGWALETILPVVLVVGVACGTINGLLVTRLGLPSLAVTIGTLTLYRGLANVILGASTVSNFPAPFNTLGVNGFLGVSWLSWSVAIFLVAAVITGIVLRMTPFGRSLYAIGLSQEAAFHAGIRVRRTKLRLFVLSGVVSAAVGLLYAFELSSAGENIGIGFELQVVTIVLLGGVSIFGGKGTILGVALAAFVYAGLRSALLLTSSFNENDFEVVSGGLLILSVLVPNAASFAQRSRALMRRGQIRDRRKLLALADAEVLDRE